MYCERNRKITTCAPFAKTIKVLHAEANLLSDSGLTNCNKLRELNHKNNIHITTFAPFAKTLKVLYTTTAGEDEIKLCNNLVELHCCDNFKTVSDDPFPEFLRKLYISYSYSPNMEFYRSIKSCKNLQLLDLGKHNENIPTDMTLPSSLMVLHANDAGNVNDATLRSCTNLRELYAKNNKNIASCAPFARTLKILNATFSRAIDDAFVQSCVNLEILHSNGNKNITIKI